MNERQIIGKRKEFFKKLKEIFFPSGIPSKKRHKIKSKSQELNHAERLMNEGKYDEVLSVLSILEKDILTDSDQLTICLIKSSLLNKLGRYQEGYKIGEQAYKKSQELRNSLQSIDALVNMTFAWVWLGDLDKAENLVT